jgi:hypothetical protein
VGEEITEVEEAAPVSPEVITEKKGEAKPETPEP